MKEYDELNRKALLMLQAACICLKAGDYDQFFDLNYKAVGYVTRAMEAAHEQKT
jgi:hypothetical protein